MGMEMAMEIQSLNHHYLLSYQQAYNIIQMEMEMDTE